jgi:DNA-binding transcriptional LysR family regulator
MEINPSHVRTLEEIARRRSFSRAADALHLSQPAVSHQIRQLESQLGVSLLERVGKRAWPTRAGELLLERGGRALRELDEAGRAVQQLAGIGGGRVRIGTGATASIYLLPPLLRRLHTRHPELELIVVTGNSGDIAKAVVDNQLDVGLVTLPVSRPQLAVAPFGVDRLVAIAPAEAPWRRRARLTPVDLARHPLILYERGGTIRRVIEAWFRRGGARPHVVMELGNEEAIKKLVGAGLGVSVSPSMAVQDEVRAGALTTRPLSPALVRRLGLVRRRDKPETPALRVFLAAVDGLSESRAKARSPGDGGGGRAARRARR